MRYSPGFMWVVYSLCTVALPFQHMALAGFADGMGLLQSCSLDPVLPSGPFNTALATVQLQWREAEVSATWVSTSFGKESIQLVKETDNLRERQKPWPQPMFTPKGSGCWPISLSKPPPCTCSWCLLPSQTRGMGDQRGNGKQYLTSL